MRTEYTEKLWQMGEERKRLTAQLAELVGNVANEIASSVPVGTEVRVTYDEHKNNPSYQVLRVIRRSSNLDSEVFLAIEDLDEDYGFIEKVFDPDEEPGSSYYLHGDFTTTIEVASRKEYLWFANHLPLIIAAFEAEEQKVIDALRQGFEALKRLVEAK